MKCEKNMNNRRRGEFQLPVHKDNRLTEDDIQLSNCVLAHLYSVWNALDGHGTLFATKTGEEKERIVGTLLYFGESSRKNKGNEKVFPLFLNLEKRNGELLLFAGVPLEETDSIYQTMAIGTSVIPLGIYADFKIVSEGCAKFRYDPFFGISIKRNLPILSERTVDFVDSLQAIVRESAGKGEIPMVPYFLLNQNTVNSRVEDFFKEKYGLDAHPIAANKLLDSEDFDKDMYYVQKGE